jgi:excisionase family DNA binding protein
MPLLKKEDAAAYIGVSVRTLQRLAGRGEIARSEERGPKGLEARFDTSDLDAYLSKHKPQALFRPSPAAALVPRQDAPLVTTGGAGGQQSPGMAALAAFGASSKLLLSLHDARALTGLSAQFLRAAIKDGKLKGRIIGKGYKIKRTDLDLYIKKL